jgi:tRNA pseudouridine32 synthase/23S rRNA pseudouridine746 synthase
MLVPSCCCLKIMLEKTPTPPLGSTLHLPRGPWSTVLECLCSHFPGIDRAVWLERMARGRVQTLEGVALGPGEPYREGLRVRYFREVEQETPIPFVEQVLHLDQHLLVVDKPHFLPVTPAGGFVEQTLLARLVRRLDNPHLVPLHRIDRLTAGLVLFSVDPASRARYQALFRERSIEKEYQALAPALPHLTFPLWRRTRLVTGEPFFRMQEVPGEANSETRIEVLAEQGEDWRYALHPVSGRKHQLRLHMAGLGAAIRNDPLYPTLQPRGPDVYSQPLQLLAKRLTFRDPISQQLRRFDSQRQLG